MAERSITTTEPLPQKPIPLLRWIGLLTAVSGLVGGTLVLSIPLWSGDPQRDRRAMVAVAVVGWAIAVGGTIAVARVGEGRFAGYFAAFTWLIDMPVRLLGTVIASVLLVKLADMPVVSTLLATVVMYAALLATETTIRFRFASKLAREQDETKVRALTPLTTSAGNHTGS